MRKINFNHILINNMYWCVYFVKISFKFYSNLAINRGIRIFPQLPVAHQEILSRFIGTVRHHLPWALVVTAMLIIK